MSSDQQPSITACTPRSGYATAAVRAAHHLAGMVGQRGAQEPVTPPGKARECLAREGTEQHPRCPRLPGLVSPAPMSSASGGLGLDPAHHHQLSVQAPAIGFDGPEVIIAGAAAEGDSSGREAIKRCALLGQQDRLTQRRRRNLRLQQYAVIDERHPRG